MARVEFIHPGGRILVMDLPEFHLNPEGILQAAHQRGLLAAAHAPDTLPTAVCRVVAGEAWERLVTGGGTATGVHHRTAVILDGKIFLAAGHSCVALGLKEGALLWHQQADETSIFGLAPASTGDRLIIHGEKVVSCWTLEGDRAWEHRGKDNLSGRMHVAGGEIRIMDFMGDEFVLSEQGQVL